MIADVGNFDSTPDKGWRGLVLSRVIVFPTFKTASIGTIMLATTTCRVWDFRDLGDRFFCGRIDGRWCEKLTASDEIGEFLCRQNGDKPIKLYWQTGARNGQRCIILRGVELEDGRRLAQLPTGEMYFANGLLATAVLSTALFLVLWGAFSLFTWLTVEEVHMDTYNIPLAWAMLIGTLSWPVFIFRSFRGLNAWKNLKAKPTDIAAHTKLGFDEKPERPPTAA